MDAVTRDRLRQEVSRIVREREGPTGRDSWFDPEREVRQAIEAYQRSLDKQSPHIERIESPLVTV